MLKLIELIKNMIKQNEFVRFIIVGCINTLNHFIIFTLAFGVLGIETFISNTMAFLISLVGSFYMNSYFTYRIKPTFKKFLAFPSVYIINYAINTLFLFLGVKVLHVSAYIALGAALFVSVPATFAISRFILKRGHTTN